METPALQQRLAFWRSEPLQPVWQCGLATAIKPAKSVAAVPSPRSFFLLVALLFALIVPAEAADVVYDNGPSYPDDGWEMTRWVEADDFVLTERTQLSSVRFWNYVTPGMFSGVVTWEIYAQAAQGGPGALLASGTSANLVHTPTGVFAFGVLQEFVTTFDITPVKLDPGTYWLALHNGPRDNVSAGMYWAPTVNTRGAPSHSREAVSNGLWYSNAFPGFLSELAFQVFGTAIPQVVGTGRLNGSPTVKFTTKAGKQYRLEYKNNLLEPTWRVVPGREIITGSGAEMQIDDPQPDARTASRRFYRVVVL